MLRPERRILSRAHHDVAYSVVGDAPLDLVFVASLMSRVEVV
jgi:hypothetical protein